MSCSDNVDDRLSMLPDDILSQILSRMPSTFAVRTSVLSKRWRYSWMLVTIIDFDDQYVHRIGGLYSFITFVDRVLELCKTSHVINLFRLRLSEIFPKESRVLKWIEKAVRLNVRELDLQVHTLRFPVSLFACQALTKLRLECRRVYDYDLSECRVNLPCLKTLEMVGFVNSYADIFKLISGSPVLESLSFEVRWRPHLDETDCIFNIPTLKRLKITSPSLANRSNRVVLNVPNLEYLFVGGELDSLFVTENVSSLVEACVSFSYIRFVQCPLWFNLLKGLSGVKSLSVQHNPSTTPVPNFPNMKRLELKSCWNRGQILQFLKSSPQLEHLYVEKLEYSDWTKPKRLPVCMLTKLTAINLSNCNGQKWEMKFLRYILGHAEVLKTLTVTWGNIGPVKEKRLHMKLPAFPRASRCCEIHVPGSGSQSTIVKRTGQFELLHLGKEKFVTMNKIYTFHSLN
ncbi:hypothetical protein SSX86_006964 [Deinandra increscens subsp. villosa]|uniref:F-box domain-containing protein n=1 Tax=Deinandra increscens subsp. villosa TaxID=3103831 RepID=A0AAP0DFW2_9ASTR